jgi:hypothetical protein
MTLCLRSGSKYCLENLEKSSSIKIFCLRLRLQTRFRSNQGGRAPTANPRGREAKKATRKPSFIERRKSDSNLA